MDNPFSLMGNVVAEMPSSFTDMATDVSDALPNLVGKFSSFLLDPSWFTSIFSSKSLAASDPSDTLAAQYNYFGVQPWGWSQKDLQTIDTDTSYSLVPNSTYVESNYQALKSDYDKCYQTVDQAKFTDPDPNNPLRVCTESYLDTPPALHWRKYELDKYNLSLSAENLQAAPSASAGQ